MLALFISLLLCRHESPNEPVLVQEEDDYDDAILGREAHA